MSEIRRNSGSSGPKNDDNLSLKSGVSVSRAAELQALEVLKEMSNPCTWKGEAAQVVKRSDLDKLVQRISAILDDGNTHSVSPIAMGTLSAELASLKLQVSEFKNRAEKAEEAARLYETDFLRATKLLDEEKVKSKREIESLSSIKAEQLSRLNEAKEELRALKLAQSKSKGTASPDTEKAAAKALKEKGDLVTSLNNQLQQSNKEIEESRSRVKRFETQVLKLQNELNIAQAQANVKPEATFAAVASAAGTATVNLSNKVWGMLSSKGKEFMLKAKNVEEGDVKGRAFWVKAAFDHTSAAAALHFKEPFLEVFEDLKVISYSSRNAFSPFVNRYISAIIGDGPPLTKEEIDRMLDEVDTTQVRMSRPYSEKGIKTLDDFIRRGGQIDGLGESDIHEDDVTESRKVFRAPAKPEPKKRKQNWYSRLKGSISSFASGVKENFITRRKRNHSLVLRLKKRWGTFWGGLLAWPLSFLSLFRKSPRSEV